MYEDIDKTLVFLVKDIMIDMLKTRTYFSKPVISDYTQVYKECDKSLVELAQSIAKMAINVAEIENLYVR